MNISDGILYSDSVSLVKVEGFYEEESFWLSQKRMAELFGVEVQTIKYHLKEIYKSGELSEIPTIRKFRIVQTEGKREVSREVGLYNLEADKNYEGDFDRVVKKVKTKSLKHEPD